jgi:hypothetical protein
MSESEASNDDAPEGEGDAPEGEADVPERSVAAEPAAAREAAPAIDATATRRIAGWAAVVFIIGTAVAMVIGVFLSLFRGPQGPWLGEYYENQEFEGEPTIRYARKIEFDYKKAAPFAGMPKDHWAVTWSTCMEIEETTEVRFRLASDDGSRLYVNDELLIDNWGAHATRTRTGKVTLEPGKHYLQVDFYEDRHGANVKLEAAMDDGEAASISPDILTQPDEDDEENPCG